MSKQSPAARAATSSKPDAISSSDRLDAIGSYMRLRDWSFAVIDLMEVAGRSMSSADRVEIGDQTLMESSALLRSLLQQIDAQVEAMREAEYAKPGGR
jgi:hypothetical protein